MKYFLLLLFMILIAKEIKPSYQGAGKYLTFSIKTQYLSEDVLNIYKSSITGNKKQIERTLKKRLKRYGLMHLLTPSGLHLSSLFFFGYLPELLILLLLTLIFIYITQFESYFSLERVILFKLIFNIAKYLKVKIPIEMIFLITMIFCTFTNNFISNPMSYLFSFLFWGTILIYKNQRFKMILFLNLSLHFSSILFDQEVLVSSLVLNPIFTTLFVFIFPILTLNYFLGGIGFINFIIEKYLSIYLNTFTLISNYDPFPSVKLGIFSFVLIWFFLSKHKFKLALLILCLHIPQTQLPKKVKASSNKFVINLADSQEILKKTSSLFFIDRRCRINQTSLKCKIKTLHRN